MIAILLPFLASVRSDPVDYNWGIPQLMGETEVDYNVPDEQNDLWHEFQCL